MKYILTLGVLFCLQFLNAQKNQDQSELLKSYTIDELEEIKTSNPEIDDLGVKQCSNSDFALFVNQIEIVWILNILTLQSASI